MKKVFFSFLIVILIFFTSIIKNSTKNIDTEILTQNYLIYDPLFLLDQLCEELKTF